MPQWFLPYTAAALVAAAMGWLALNYDPDADSQTATPVLAGTPASGAQPVAAPAQGNEGSAAPAPAPAPSAEQPAPAPAPEPDSGEEAAVRQLVIAAMTTSRPEDCTRLYTQAFLEQ